MPPATGAGSGKDSANSIAGLSQKFDQLAELVRSLTVEVQDVKQQQQALSVSMLRLKAGTGDNTSS
jgi:hypothetical protein